jgi:hypothetical protein
MATGPFPTKTRYQRGDEVLIRGDYRFDGQVGASPSTRPNSEPMEISLVCGQVFPLNCLSGKPCYWQLRPRM